MPGLYCLLDLFRHIKFLPRPLSEEGTTFITPIFQMQKQRRRTAKPYAQIELVCEWSIQT